MHAIQTGLQKTRARNSVVDGHRSFFSARDSDAAVVSNQFRPALSICLVDGRFCFRSIGPTFCTALIQSRRKNKNVIPPPRLMARNGVLFTSRRARVRYFPADLRVYLSVACHIKTLCLHANFTVFGG